MRRVSLLFLTIVLFAACTRKEPRTVVVDSWWSYDYAKNACWYKSQPPAGTPCVADPTAQIRDFEDRMDTAFATQEICSGTRVLHFAGQRASPDIAYPKHYWTVMVSLGEPDTMQGEWSIVMGEKHEKVLNGDINNNPEAVVKQICRVVNGRGAEIR